MTWASENITTREKLVEQNQNFKVEQLRLREQIMQLAMLKQENARLRQLLASPVRQEIKKMVAEILSVNSDPYSHQVLINRGANDGVYEGQPVLDANGVVGQILHVGATSSRLF